MTEDLIDGDQLVMALFYMKKMGSLVSILMISACSQVLPFGSKPERTFSLRYEGDISALPTGGPIVFLDEPLMAEGLGGRTFAVEIEGRERTILKDARWSSSLSDLVRSYFERLLGASSKAQIIGEGGLDVRAGCRLSLRVWSFQLVPGRSRSEDDRVSVSFEAGLVHLSKGDLLARQLFASDTIVEGNDAVNVVDAYHGVLEKLGGDMVDWFNAALPACSESEGFDG